MFIHFKIVKKVMSYLTTHPQRCMVRTTSSYRLLPLQPFHPFRSHYLSAILSQSPSPFSAPFATSLKSLPGWLLSPSIKEYFVAFKNQEPSLIWFQVEKIKTQPKEAVTQLCFLHLVQSMQCHFRREYLFHPEADP